MPPPKRGEGYSGIISVHKRTGNSFLFSRPNKDDSIIHQNLLVQNLPENGLDSGEVYMLEFFYRTHPFAHYTTRSFSFSFSSNETFLHNQYIFGQVDVVMDSFPSREKWHHFKASFTATGNEKHILIHNRGGSVAYMHKYQNPQPLPIHHNWHLPIENWGVILIDDVHLFKASDTLFSVDLGNDTVLCMEDSLILTASPHGFALEDTVTTWEWSTGHTTESILVTRPGIYSVVVTINETYKAYDTIVVEYEPYPVWGSPFNSELVLCKEESGIAKTAHAPNVTRGAEYLWSTGSTKSYETFNQTGEASLRMITPCYDQTRSFKIVERFCLKIEPYIPSAFTPNGLNPLWIIGGIEENTQVEVFNRWGQRVFKSDDYLNNWWDGTFNGQILPAGVYTYRIVAHYEMRDPVQKIGTVIIVR